MSIIAWISCKQTLGPNKNDNSANGLVFHLFYIKFVFNKITCILFVIHKKTKIIA